MPFCVNCGSEIERDTTVCPNCKNSPWYLTGETLKEVDEVLSKKESPDVNTAAIISVFVLVGAISLLFGATIWQLGIFGGSGSGSYKQDAYPSREPVYEDTSKRMAISAPYHVYQSFNFGTFLPVVALIGTIMLIHSWYRLYRDMLSTRILTLAMCGIVFIILSMFIFIFGFHDLLTFTGGETWKKPTFTQQYAWIIETVVFGFLGCVMLFFAERARKNSGVKKSVYPIVMIPMAYVLFFAALFIFVIGFHNFIHASDYTHYRGNLAWAIETLVFGSSCFFLFSRTETIRKNTGKESGVDKIKSPFVTPLLITSAVLFMATTLVYIYGVNAAFWDLKDNVDIKWFLEAFVFAIPCVGFMMKAERIRKIENGGESLIPKFLLPVSAVLLFAAVILYFTAVHLSLYEITKVNYSWIVELIMFVVPCAALLMTSENIIRKREGHSSIVPHFTIPLAYLMLFVSLLVYVFGIHHSMWEYEFKRNDIWVLELVAFAIPSLIFLLISTLTKNTKRDGAILVEQFILFASFILTLSAIFTYVMGIFGVFAKMPLDSHKFLLIILESIFLILPVVILLTYIYKIRKQKPEMKSVTSGLIPAVAYILLVAFSIVYIMGIFEAMSPSSGKNIMLIAEALLFALPGFYLLFKLDSIRKKDGVVKSLLTSPLLAIGSFFVIATILFVYIFGLHGVFSDRPFDSDRFLLIALETIILGSPAGAFLIIADTIRRRESGGVSIIPGVLAPVSYMLLISFTLVYLFGVHDTFSTTNKDLIWVFEALLFAIPAFYLLVRSDNIKRIDIKRIENMEKNEGRTRSLLVTPLYIMGGLFIIATLLSFIFGFNDFLYSNKPNINWFMETIAYLIPAGISLYIADRLK